jgi:hypothetical protein
MYPGYLTISLNHAKRSASFLEIQRTESKAMQMKKKKNAKQSNISPASLSGQMTNHQPIHFS